MKNIFSIFFLPVLLYCNTLQAQKKSSLELFFNAKYYNSNIQFDTIKYNLLNNTDSISFRSIKFYVSNIVLLKKGKKIFTEKESYHLIDISNNKSCLVDFEKLNNSYFDEISFNLGIDSITNSKGALDKDLDPIKGMYWAWHSGFINLKLEGSSNVCKTRNNHFQFHLGGFLNGFDACKKVILKVENRNKITISLNIDKFINSINLSEVNEIMTPGRKAVELSKIMSQCFSISNF